MAQSTRVLAEPSADAPPCAAAEAEDQVSWADDVFRVELLASTLEASPDACFVLDHAWRFIYANRRAERLIGHSRAGLLGLTIWETLPEAVCGELQREYHSVMERRVPVELTWRTPGTAEWYDIRMFPSPHGLLVIARDISERRRSELVLAGQNRILEMLATDQPEETILLALCGMLEAQMPDAYASIMIAAEDGLALYPGAALRLDPAFVAQIQAIPVGHASGSCGTAAFLRRPVVVTDIVTDPLWEPWRDLALSFDLRACWSVPILRHEESSPVLGTFAVYFQEPRQPTAIDLAIINEAGNLARVVIERTHARRAMQRAEARFQSLVEKVPAVVYSEAAGASGPLASNLYISPRVMDLVGFSAQEWARDNIWEQRLHPDDLDRVLAEDTHANTTGEPFSSDYRMIHRDGRVVWIHDESVLVRDDEGTPVAWQGVLIDVTEQKNAAQQLRDAEHRYRTLVESVPALVYRRAADDDHTPLYISPQFKALFGASSEQWHTNPQSWLDIIHPDDREKIRMLVAAARASGDPFTAEYRTHAADGHLLWVRDEMVLARDEDGEPLYWQGVLVDISQKKLIEEERRISEELFRGAFEDAAITMSIAAIDGKLLRVNRVFCDMLGYTEEELLHSYNTDLTHPDDVAMTKRYIVDLVQGSERALRVEKRYLHKDGSVVWALLNLSVVRDADGAPVHLLGQIQDITARKHLEADLAHQALHDALTGLPNRALLLDRTRQALAEFRRHRSPMALLFIDIDNFKIVNDSLGHVTGDHLLADVAARLSGCLRADDTAARIGGDEFAVLVKTGKEPSAVRDLAERITAAIRRPYIIGEHQVLVTISVGIALPTTGMTDSYDLLRWADIAMYRAKAHGKNRYDIFDPEMHASSLRRMELQHELAQAIEQEELTLHYQPEISLQTGGVIGFEALVRWDHPTHGTISPAEFIPLAEETGLIAPLGVWVLEHACQQMQEWRTNSPMMSGLTLAVNLSPRQFQADSLVAEVWRVLDATRLPSDCLILEITESAMMDDFDVTSQSLQALTRLGVQLAIDDFGMGYSSLAQVKRFPLAFLKIDRQFVNDLGVELEGTVIVSGIVGLAHALGVAVVAEGVETRQQVEQLRGLGCDIAQGFYFSKPMLPEQVEAFVRERGVATSLSGAIDSARLAPVTGTGILRGTLDSLIDRQEQLRASEQRITEEIRDLRFRLGQPVD